METYFILTENIVPLSLHIFDVFFNPVKSKQNWKLVA